MSGTINTIPASAIVAITPSVVSGGGSALDLIGLFLTTNTRVPIGTVLSFPTLLSVGSYFGATSDEYLAAAVYFAGFNGANKLPGALLLAQYPTADVGAYLRGASVAGLTLTQLQALTGLLTVTIDGVAHTSSTINLASATSFSAAAQAITTALGLTGPTQAIVTASIGATFTGTGSGTNLTVTSPSGTIHPGSAASASISGTGVPANTYLVSQASGTTGGAGVYVTNNATTSSAATITATSTTMDVSAVSSGAIAVGQEITGAGITSGTFIGGLVTGTGGTGTYLLTQGMQVVSETVTLVMPTCTWDSVSGGFILVSGTTGAASTIGFASGTLSASLSLTQTTGAVTSQGADTAVPATFMNAIIAQTQNWATLHHLFDPDGGSGNTEKLAFAAWINSVAPRYLYAVTDTDITPTLSVPATSSLVYTLEANKYSGTAPSYEPVGANLQLSSFLAGFVASLDFPQTNGRATAAFKSQAGIGPSVTNATVAANLIANGYNLYGDYATANDVFDFYYPGQVCGPFAWIDSYVNQIWLTNAMQLALMEMLTQYKSIPYNPAGYALIRAAIADPVAQALNFGAIRINVPLSNAQAAAVNNAAGLSIDGTLFTQGYYLQILPATSQVRAARQSPPITLWYMDGQSVQHINMASVLIQ